MKKPQKVNTAKEARGKSLRVSKKVGKCPKSFEQATNKLEKIKKAN